MSHREFKIIATESTEDTEKYKKIKIFVCIVAKCLLY
jgi:hypothetical protein